MERQAGDGSSPSRSRAAGPPQANLGEPCSERAPLPGLDEHRGHAGRGVQDLVDLHLRPAVYTVPLARVARGQVVHHRELVVTAALGAEPDLVPMVLDLGLVPQRRLDLRGRGKRRERHGMFLEVSGPHAETASWEGVPLPQMAILGSCEAPKGATGTATPTHGGREPAITHGLVL